MMMQCDANREQLIPRSHAGAQDMPSSSPPSAALELRRQLRIKLAVDEDV